LKNKESKHAKRNQELEQQHQHQHQQQQTLIAGLTTAKQESERRHDQVIDALERQLEAKDKAMQTLRADNRRLEQDKDRMEASLRVLEATCEEHASSLESSVESEAMLRTCLEDKELVSLLSFSPLFSSPLFSLSSLFSLSLFCVSLPFPKSKLRKTPN